MSRFIKLDVKASSLDSHGKDQLSSSYRLSRGHGIHWVNIYTIDEIVPGRYTGTKQGKSTSLAGTAFVIHYEAPAGSPPTDRDTYLVVEGEPEDWVAKIEKMIADDIAAHHPPPPPEPEEPPAINLPITGVWKSLKLYAKDDVVQDPDDATLFFLSLRENQSSQKPTVKSHTGWCVLPKQKAAE